MDVVVYGKGVTGSATGAVLESAGLRVHYEDPPKRMQATPRGEPKWVFLCVPTPAGDLLAVVTAVRSATERFPGVPIVIRSTVPPGTLQRLERTHPGAVFVLMPEFLREATALEDAMRKDRAIFATHSDSVAQSFAGLLETISYHSIRRVSVAEAELIKFATNGLIAVKVAFANAIYDLAEATGADFDRILSLLEADGRFTRFGLEVPGRHGRGYAGMCLPKDMAWLDMSLRAFGQDAAAEMIEAIQDYNGDVRDRQEIKEDVA